MCRHHHRAQLGVDQLVVFETAVVVKADRTAGVSGFRQLGGTLGNLAPTGISPRQQFIRTIQGKARGVTLGGIGRRGERQAFEDISRFERENAPRVRNAGVDISGVQAAIKQVKGPLSRAHQARGGGGALHLRAIRRGLGWCPVHATIAGYINTHLRATHARHSHHQVALNRQIGPGLVESAVRREGVNSGHLCRCHTGQASLHGHDSDGALCLCRSEGVAQVFRVREELVQIRDRACEGTRTVRARDDHIAAAHGSEHAILRRQGDRHGVAEVPSEWRAGEDDARLFITRRIELCGNRHSRRACCRSNHFQNLIGDHAREVQVTQIGTGLDQRVTSQFAHEDIAVNAFPTGQAVQAGHCVQRVLTGTASDLVRTCACIEHVIAQAAKHFVIAFACDEGHGFGAGRQRAQGVVAQQVNGATAARPQHEGVVTLSAAHIEVDVVEQSRRIKRIVALAHVNNHLGHAGVAPQEAREFHIHGAGAGTTQDDVFSNVVSGKVQAVCGARAHVQGQHPGRLVQGSQHRFHRGRRQSQRRQLQLEQLEGHGARQGSLAPDVRAQ